MLLTDRFVFIHLPKCGGTFVTAMLKDIHHYRPSRLGRMISNLVPNGLGPLVDTDRWGTKHDGCHAIPRAHRDKLIVASVRNPYDRYVSQFHFRWWVRSPERLTLPLKEIEKLYPGYPEISFHDFVMLSNTHVRFTKYPGILPNEHLGAYSVRFLTTFFRDPQRAYPLIDDKYINESRCNADMLPIRFLNMERLNQDLHDFLLSVGYPAERISRVCEADRIRPGSGRKRSDYDWQKHYTPDLKAFVRSREKLIFSIFPEFDV